MGLYRWMRAGAEWRGRDVTAQAEASGNNFGFGTRVGGALSAAVDIDDRWQVGGGAAVLSRDTPLRALKHDIRSNSLNPYLRWRAATRLKWTLSFPTANFPNVNVQIPKTH